jgi:hypothetical protein
VSSRTSKPKNGVLATEEGSIYDDSIRQPAVALEQRFMPAGVANPCRATLEIARRRCNRELWLLRLDSDRS